MAQSLLIFAAHSGLQSSVWIVFWKSDIEFIWSFSLLINVAQQKMVVLLINILSKLQLLHTPPQLFTYDHHTLCLGTLSDIFTALMSDPVFSCYVPEFCCSCIKFSIIKLWKLGMIHSYSFNTFIRHKQILFHRLVTLIMTVSLFAGLLLYFNQGFPSYLLSSGSSGTSLPGMVNWPQEP